MTGAVVADRLSARQEQIAGVVARVLRVPTSLVLPETSFAELGMDSLAAVELTAAIEDALGIELPLTAVHECPTLASLCVFIEGGVGARCVVPREQMLADAILPADVTPDARLVSSARRTCDARHVLVTGATGFVGAFIVAAIAEETDAIVHCLIRPGDRDPGERLRSHLARYGLLSDALVSRIRVVVGDLATPRLGMSHDEFRDRSATVDAIYHAAADVNWVSPYEALRAANVQGTLEVLRFACTGVPKPFHFLSSVSVCHSTLAPRNVDEALDPMASLDGLWMGYAQSKCVAEQLVRDAGRRGLPVTITRPSLVTGDARHGRSNPDDLVSRFVAGCVAMRAAPDLDWRMDCVPVDDVATSVVRLANDHSAGIATSHVTAASPRHWRECVLWMRLSGYDVELVPYREWIAMLRETSPSNPLYSLRPFFLRTIAAEDYLTLPELLEEPRRSHVSDHRTRTHLSTLGHVSRPLDTRLLGRYFDDFERHALVPRAPRRPRAQSDETSAPVDLTAVLPEMTRELGIWLGDDSLAIESLRLQPANADDSIVAELTAWRGGSRAGLYRASLRVSGRRTAQRSIELFVKAKPADADVIDVAESVADLASPRLGEMVSRFRDHLGFTRSHTREVALYADRDQRLRDHTPRVFGTRSDDAACQWLVVLESIDAANGSSATTAEPSDWKNESIEAALTGLARIHSVGFDRFEELSAARWQAPLRDGAQRVEMAPLWSSLAVHAFERSVVWSDRQLRHIHSHLVEDVAGWSHVLDQSPRTLIHNDFNPRNIVVRRTNDARTLCAFDWELATIGAPQRDLAEFLAFVLASDCSRAVIARWVERYRLLLERASGLTLHRGEWEHGLSAALCDLLVDRLASYAMVDRIRAQSFLPRVVRGWANLNRYYSWHG